MISGLLKMLVGILTSHVDFEIKPHAKRFPITCICCQTTYIKKELQPRYTINVYPSIRHPVYVTQSSKPAGLTVWPAGPAGPLAPGGPMSVRLLMGHPCVHLARMEAACCES